MGQLGLRHGEPDREGPVICGCKEGGGGGRIRGRKEDAGEGGVTTDDRQRKEGEKIWQIGMEWGLWSVRTTYGCGLEDLSGAAPAS